MGEKTALNDADLPPELVTQPKEVVVGNEVEEGGDGTDEDNDDTMIEALHHQEAGFQLACIGGLLQDPGVFFLCAPKARQIFWTLVVFILKGPQFILGPAAGPQCTLVVYAQKVWHIPGQDWIYFNCLKCLTCRERECHIVSLINSYVEQIWESNGRDFLS